MYFQVLYTFLLPQLYKVLNVIRLFIMSHCLLARKDSRSGYFVNIFDQSDQVM